MPWDRHTMAHQSALFRAAAAWMEVVQVEATRTGCHRPGPAAHRFCWVALIGRRQGLAAKPTDRGLCAVIGYLETFRRIDVRPDSVQVPGEALPHCGCPLVSLVWLSHGLRSRRAPREERLERGL